MKFNSKIISILVEEALSIRGIFNKKYGKGTQSYRLNNNISNDFPGNSDDFIDKSESSIDTKLLNHVNLRNSNHLNEVNNEGFDLKTYKKFLSFLKFQEMIEKYDT